MYKQDRAMLAGHPASKHSMNQRQMKLTADRSRLFFREHPQPVVPASDAAVSLCVLDASELAALVATGIFGGGPNAELEAAVHTVGCLISRVQPVQLQSGRA